MLRHRTVVLRIILRFEWAALLTVFILSSIVPFTNIFILWWHCVPFWSCSASIVCSVLNPPLFTKFSFFKVMNVFSFLFRFFFFCLFTFHCFLCFLWLIYFFNPTIYATNVTKYKYKKYKKLCTFLLFNLFSTNSERILQLYLSFLTKICQGGNW
jgi:hypothetical protein